MDFAHELGGSSGLELYSNDSFKAAHQRLAMEEFNKFVLTYYSLYKWRGDNALEGVATFKETLPQWEAYVTKYLKGQDFFGGSGPDMTDINAFPHCERLIVMEQTAFVELAKFLNLKETAPNLVAWVHRMLAHPVVAPMAMSVSAQNNFF